MFRLSYSIRNLIFASILLAFGCENGGGRESSSSPSTRESFVVSNDQTAGPVATMDEVLHTDEEPLIEVDTPTRDRPVTAAMFCQKVSENTDTVTLNVWIRLLVARGHYIYAPTDTQGPFRTLEVQMPLEVGANRSENWQYPNSKLKNGSAVYIDSVVIHRQLSLPADAVSNLEAKVNFQVCNEDVCYPPTTLKLVGSFGRTP